ncbi:hypothetical protein [Actinomadura atramentaria]|uniref:hypothetical protein n=1 Tax=Actinomadura atramentaria TaxID=1990 RepID=UPI000361A559|nr:hypothetical protein [Actinomadura atramentaria]
MSWDDRTRSRVRWTETRGEPATTVRRRSGPVRSRAARPAAPSTAIPFSHRSARMEHAVNNTEDETTEALRSALQKSLDRRG